MSTFKGLIIGECIRYVRINSSKDNYLATLEQFKQRLYKRQYPTALVNKTTRKINYKQRQNYLKEPTIANISKPKPTFKCLPPPNYNALKAIILQHYRMVQRFAPRPRFIPLRHKKLGEDLIRAKIYPTDEQFVDMVLTTSQEFHSLNSTSHNATRPTLRPCNIRCATCQHLNCDTHFRSTTNGRTHPIRRSFTCKSSNVIYLITCKKCKKQYVGLTTKQLNYRICRHRSNITHNQPIYISRHFNFKDHNIHHLAVQAIDQADNLEELKKLERFWILTLDTVVPKGLNVTIGHGAL